MSRRESSRNLKKDVLFDQLLNSIEARHGDARSDVEFHKWVEGVILDGRAFSYERHEYLRTPYEDDHMHQVFIKATQLGLTSLALLKVAFRAKFAGFRGILYLFPNRGDVIDFSKGRVDPLINDNPDTIGAWIRDTDAAGVKRIHNCFLYLRGMKSRVGLKSVPIDFTVFDEIDEADQSMVDMAVERMSHSEFKEILKLSNPTLPDYGIDKAFQGTDQRHYLLKCGKCNYHTCLEDSFPDCLLETQDGVKRVCMACKNELDPANGVWVAKKPGVEDRRGYRFSQLYSHYVDPGEILHQFRTTNNLTDFYNLKIGCAHVEATNRLSVQEVLNLCGSDGIVSEDNGPCFMGVDQGASYLHACIGKRHPSKAGKIIHLGIYGGWEELDRLIKNFHVSRCIVDAMPETRNARAFAERNKGKVYLNYYTEHQKGAYKWNEENLTVTTNRTESLDASHSEIMTSRIILPRASEIVNTFAEHLHNVAKKLEQDEDTGSKRYQYVRLGDDHFRHAYNLECIARQYGSGSFFGDSDLS